MVKFALGGGGGRGYSPNFRVGVCHWDPKSLTLFLTKKSFKMILKAREAYPILDIFRSISLLRTSAFVL